MYETYKADVTCSNCGTSYTDDSIPKGMRVTELKCENCGCATLNKSASKTLSEIKNGGGVFDVAAGN